MAVAAWWRLVLQPSSEFIHFQSFPIAKLPGNRLSDSVWWTPLALKWICAKELFLTANMFFFFVFFSFPLSGRTCLLLPMCDSSSVCGTAGDAAAYNFAAKDIRWAEQTCSSAAFRVVVNVKIEECEDCKILLWGYQGPLHSWLISMLKSVKVQIELFFPSLKVK